MKSNQRTVAFQVPEELFERFKEYLKRNAFFLRRLFPVPASAILRMEGVLSLNRKQKKKLRRHLSTRQFMGIDQLTDHGLKTAKGELVFFLISPDNLSVLSAEGVRSRVRALTDLLRGMESAELLRQDAEHLDDIQSTTASAREFVLVLRIDIKSNEETAA